MTLPAVTDPAVMERIHDLFKLVGAESGEYEEALAEQLIQTALRLLLDKTDLGEMKLMTRALKEMRHAYRIFSYHKSARRVAIFGSARTKEDHPDYQAASHFSDLMCKAGWDCITGAAEGIMRAGLEGAPLDSRFGLSIRLPWESGANPLIDNDPKLIMFRYFFTRKLMFVSQSDAFAAFPGGYGTMDELFEVLTLIQTGKAEIMPVVLVEGTPSEYWRGWEEYVKNQLLAKGWISPQDLNLYFHAKSPEEAEAHIVHFYSNYHSSRYVKDNLVIRLQREPKPEDLKVLSQEYKDLIVNGEITACPPFPEEKDALELFRITFIHTRKDFGRLRSLIDTLNSTLYNF